MNFLKRRTKPIAAVAIPAAPVDPEPIVESPTAPESMKVSVILDAESITALIQQLSYFYQRTAEKLYEWDQCFLKNVAENKIGSYTERDKYEHYVFMRDKNDKNLYAWQNGVKLEDFYWRNKDKKSFEIEFEGGNL